jgi:sec-independent protein translocase protein TatA
MGSLSIWHWLIVAVFALVLFGGGGKLSGLMGDAAKGIKAFKDGLKDEDDVKKAEEEARKAAEKKAEEEAQKAADLRAQLKAELKAEEEAKKTASN